MRDWLVSCGHSAAGFLGLVFGAALLSPFVIVAWQALEWLKTGVWEKWPFWRFASVVGLPEPYSSWGGVQQIIRWVYDLPTAAVIPLVAYLGIWIVSVVFPRWHEGL